MKMTNHVQTSMALGFLVLFATCAVADDAKKSASGKAAAKSIEKTGKPTETPTEKVTEKPTVKSTTKRSTKAKSKRSTRETASVIKGRLPRYFGKLGLDDGQRQRVYELQAEYDAKITSLLAQIEELQTSRNSHYQKILKPTQREKLEDLVAARKKSLPDKKSNAKVASKSGAAKKASDGGQR